MFDSLDPLIATAAVVLSLSLIVQGLQQIIKQWFDLKSSYMKLQVLAMFDSSQLYRQSQFSGLGSIANLGKQADAVSQTIVAGLESVLGSFGYKDLELLQQMDIDKFKQIVSSIDWTKIQGVSQVQIDLEKIKKDIDTWFEVAKKAFQDLYERRMKVWSYLLSAIVVIGLNANLIDVYRVFSTDKSMRDAALGMGAQLTSMSRDSIVVRHEAADRPNSVAILSKPDSVVTREIQNSLARIQELMSDRTFEMLRWNKAAVADLTGPSWAANLIRSIVGWFGMTMLVGLGAPFWYDILKAIMGIKDRMKQAPAAPEIT